MRRGFYTAVVVGVLVGMAQSASAALIATDILDYSVFGNTGVGTGTNVDINSGLLGSNAAISTLGNGSHTQGVLAGTNMGTGTNVIITGNVTVNGNLSTLGNGSTVNGNVDVGGNISTGSNVHINGNATAGGTIGLGSGSAVSGTSTPSGTPNSMAPVTLPSATSFSAGGSNVTTDGTLAPNVMYGALTLGTNKTLNLSSGDYYFDSILIGNGLTLNIDLSGGSHELNIFSLGNVTFGTNMAVNVTGGTAADIYAETHGAWMFGNGDEWFGTVYAPDGNISTGTNNVLTGALYSGKKIDTLGNGSSVDFVAANYLKPQQPVPGDPTIPEPASLVLFGLGGMGAGLLRRRRTV